MPSLPSNSRQYHVCNSLFTNNSCAISLCTVYNLKYHQISQHVIIYSHKTEIGGSATYSHHILLSNFIKKKNP